MATHKGSSGVVKVAASGGTEAVVGEVRSYSIDEWLPSLSSTRNSGWVVEMRQATNFFASLEWHPNPSGIALGMELAHVADTNNQRTSALTGFEARAYLAYCRFCPRYSGQGT